jgi:hypothetical protein
MLGRRLAGRDDGAIAQLELFLRLYHSKRTFPAESPSPFELVDPKGLLHWVTGGKHFIGYLERSARASMRIWFLSAACVEL